MTRFTIPFVALPNGWPAFRAAVVAGAAVGFALSSAVALLRGPSFQGWLVTAAAAALAAYVYGVAVKLLTGGEWTASFQSMASVFTGAWAALRLTGLPPLPYLDLLALGLCANQAVGRLGCLLAGCCHGRPARRGVVYTDAHAAHGFAWHLVGIVLAPTQLLEAVALALLAAGLALLALGAHAAGDVLAVYFGGYALVRALLDPWRGDFVPYAFGLGRAQLATLGFTLLVARLSALGVLPARRAYEVAPLALAALAAGLAAWRRLDPARRARWLAPAHVEELAAVVAALARVPASEPVPRVLRTSEGLRLSGSTARNVAPAHVTVSRRAPPLAVAEARVLAALLGQLLRRPGPELIAGAPGIFHVVLPPPPPAAHA